MRLLKHRLVIPSFNTWKEYLHSRRCVRVLRIGRARSRCGPCPLLLNALRPFATVRAASRLTPVRACHAGTRLTATAEESGKRSSVRKCPSISPSPSHTRASKDAALRCAAACAGSPHASPSLRAQAKERCEHASGWRVVGECFAPMLRGVDAVHAASPREDEDGADGASKVAGQPGVPLL